MNEVDVWANEWRGGVNRFCVVGEYITVLLEEVGEGILYAIHKVEDACLQRIGEICILDVH